MKSIFSLLLFLVFATPLWSVDEIDLSGTWEVTLLQCLDGESSCLKNSEKLGRTFEINAPENLHARFPWFYGVAEYQKSFEYHASPEVDQTKVLLTGSIGSIDETFLNGVLLGFTGEHNSNITLSAWNTVRAYAVPPGSLQRGKNLITIKVKVLDPKAGLHAGPLVLAPQNSLTLQIFWLRLIREYFYTAIPFLVMIILVVLIFTSRYWSKGEGNLYLTIAFVGYLIHSLYFIPVPIPGEYRVYLQLYWAMRLLSVFGTALYFFRSFGVHDTISFYTPFLILGFGSIQLVLQSDTMATSSTIQIHYFLYLFLLFMPPFYARKKYFKYGEYRAQLMGTVMVSGTYISDLVMLTRFNSFPWMYHYFSVVSVFHFLYFYSFHLYMWRERGRMQGLHDAEVRHLKEKLRMAHELHDMVGSELSQIVAGTERLPPAQTTLHQLAVSSLDKVRSFAHILKGEEEIDDLPKLLVSYARRLAALRKFELTLFFNRTVVFQEQKTPESYVIDTATDATVMSTGLQDKEDLHLEAYTLMQLDRILSEWIANVIRHARPEKIELGYRTHQRGLIIFIWQNKPAFVWDGSAKKGGLGSIAWRSRNIKARVKSKKHKGGSIFLLRIAAES